MGQVAMLFCALLALCGQLKAVNGQLTGGEENGRENQSLDRRLLNSMRQIEILVQSLNEKFDRLNTLEGNVLKHAETLIANSTSAMSDMISRRFSNFSQQICSPNHALGIVIKTFVTYIVELI